MKTFLQTSLVVVLSLFTALPFASRAQTATFDITYNGFTPEAQAAFQQAADNWGNILVSAVPIKVNAYFTFLLPDMLGITFPNGRRDFSGAPLAQTWYVTSLANSIAGVKLNPDEADIDVYLNSLVDWYYPTSGTVPAGQYDFTSVAMHELCHGFGFVSLAKKDNDGIGSFGLLVQSDFAPLAPSFEWPELDTLPSVFDRLLVNNAGERLDTFDNPSNALGAALTSNNLFIDGTHAVAANNGVKPKAYAPGVFSLGSSIHHLNESTFPTGNANEMMTPNGAPGNANHSPGPITLGLLRDIGWNLNPALSVNETSSQPTIMLYPNPAQEKITVSLFNQTKANAVIEMHDATGRQVALQLANASLNTVDVSGLSPGFYFVTVGVNGSSFRSTFVKQ